MSSTSRGRLSLKVGAILFAASLALTACGATVNDTPATPDTSAGTEAAPSESAAAGGDHRPAGAAARGVALRNRRLLRHLTTRLRA